MATDDLAGDFFKTLFEVFKDMMSPVLAIFGDNEAKAELFGSLGLKPDANVGSEPSSTNLDQYIATEAGEADAFALASAMHDLVQITLAIEGAIRAGLDADDIAEGGESHAIDEILNAFINVMMMDYIRRKSPAIHSGFDLMSTINHKTVEAGGNIAFGKMIGDFFSELGSGLDTPESTRSVSYTSFTLLAILLYVIDRCVLKENGIDNVDLRFDMGYEGFNSSTTPLADEATDRTMTMSMGVIPFDDPDTQFRAFTTFCFVPESHDGPAFITDLSGEVDVLIPISDDISLKFDVSGEGLFRVGQGAEADFGINNKIVITFKHKTAELGKIKIFPTPEIRVGLNKYALKIGATVDDFDVNLDTEIPLLIQRDADAGFPLNFLPEKKEHKIPLAFGVSIKRGLYFGGSELNTKKPADDTAVAASGGGDTEDPEFVAALVSKLLNFIDVNTPLNEDIGGVIGFQTLIVKVNASDNLDEMKLEASIDFWLKLGPLTISISRIGANMVLTKRDDNGGVLGYDMAPEFKPPEGAGIVIDAGAVKGGGYLYFDDDNGEYFGAIELSFTGLFDLKAIGLINTKDKDGRDTFSMIVLVTAEFTPIALGFGFTLDGVGGLLGLNRTVEVEALRIGVRTNAIKSIMFPEDVVANISRIISDIKDFFPMRDDQFVIGLMAKIGYSGADLVSIELGVIVEVPDPKVIILGVVKVVAPTDEVDALKLQVNFLGLIDFQNQFAYLEAHLYDSHVVGFPLTGSLAMVVGWGNNGMFAVSVGGFHPDFKDYPTVPTLPGAFRGMARLGFSLLSGDNPSLTVECYFAVTSNSFQFGAKLELLASGPMGFNLYGLLALDALFIFDPFSFIVNLQATLAIRKGTKILFGISFRGLLKGPEPWHVEGEVTFGLLFFDVTIGFSHTWGNTAEEIAAITADLVGMVRSELQDQRNWNATTSNNLHNAVSHKALEDLSAEETLVILPFGELQFSQRKIPLDYKIDKYGEARPLDANKISIDEVHIGSSEEATTARTELFASGNFTNLSEQEKLSRKSFERFNSGFNLADSGRLLTAEPDLPPVDLDYELNYTVDDEPDTFIVGITNQLFKKGVRLASVASSHYGWAQSPLRELNRVEAVELTPETYTIASTKDFAEVDSEFRTTTLAEAEAHRSTLVANDPDAADKYQVVMGYEIAG